MQISLPDVCQEMKTIIFQVTSFFIRRISSYIKIIKAKSQNLCNRHDRFDVIGRAYDYNEIFE